MEVFVVLVVLEADAVLACCYVEVSCVTIYHVNLLIDRIALLENVLFCFVESRLERRQNASHEVSILLICPLEILDVAKYVLLGLRLLKREMHGECLQEVFEEEVSVDASLYRGRQLAEDGLVLHRDQCVIFIIPPVILKVLFKATGHFFR